MSRQAKHCPSVSSKARDKTLLKRFFTMFYSQAQVAVVEIMKYLGAPKAFHKESTCIGCDPQTGVTKFLSRRKKPVIHIGAHPVQPHRDPVMFNLCARIQQVHYYTWETSFRQHWVFVSGVPLSTVLFILVMYVRTTMVIISILYLSLRK